MQAQAIELRSYPMRPLGRDSFIDNFEAHYLREMERFGAIVLGQFRVVDDPDRFIWLRGFPNLQVRANALEQFYAGEVWKRHGPISVALFLRPLTNYLLQPLTGTDLTAGRTLEMALGAFETGTVSAATDIVAIDTFRSASPDTRAALAADISTRAASIFAEKGSAFRGLLIGEDSTIADPGDAILDHRLIVMMTAYESLEVALATRQRVMPDLAGGLEDELAEPISSVLLRPTLRSAMRF